ncbi:MAG: tail protein X [Pseudomonadota bacterium]
MAVYTTIEGDVLDQICYRHYGRHRLTVEAVLDVNRHLAAQPLKLPAGLQITLPDLAPSTPQSSFKLFE